MVRRAWAPTGIKSVELRTAIYGLRGRLPFAAPRTFPQGPRCTRRRSPGLGFASRGSRPWTRDARLPCAGGRDARPEPRDSSSL